MAGAHINLKTMTDEPTLAALQKSLIEKPDQPDLLQQYVQQAVEFGGIPQAIGFLDRLQREHPWNHAIRRSRIALCLHRKEYHAAMEAVETLVAFSKPDDDLIDSAMAIRAHLGPRSIDRSCAAKPTISLCMIVKDEQAFLGTCLNAIKRLVDEIIVVDTGSADRSRDIAEIYGATVFQEKWQDDFALARNRTLERAQGDWILILDADEVIDGKDFEALRMLISNEDATKNAYSIQTRNYINLANAMDWQPNDRSYPKHEAGIGWFPTNKVRLFPNIDAIRFDFPVHEMVDPRVRRAGLTIEECPVPVHHYGHLNETKNQRKAETYFKLGYAKLDQLGNDSAALRELAVQAGQLGRWRESIDLWKRVLDAHPGYHEAYVNMAGACWQLGQYDQGIDYSKKAIQINPDIKEGHYNLAVNLIMKGEAKAAESVLVRILEKNEQYVPARFMLTAVQSITFDQEKARDAFTVLENEMSPQVLSIAVDDLVNKLESSGRFNYAKAVKTSLEAE